MNHEISSQQIWGFIRSSIRPFRGAIFVLMMVAIICAIDVSLRPYFLKMILDRLVDADASQVVELVATPIALYIGMYFLQTTSHRFFDYFVLMNMVPKLRTKIANEAMSRLLNKSHAYYQNNFSGSLANKVSDLTSCIPDLLHYCLYGITLQAGALVAALIVLWQVSVWFAVFMLVWALLFIVVAKVFSKKLVRLADDWSEVGSSISGFVVDVLSNMLSVRLFRTKNKELNSLNDLCQKSFAAERQLELTYAMMWFFYGYSFLVLQLVNFYILCKGYQEGWISVGGFALVVMINLSIFDCIWKIAEEFSRFSKLFGKITQALRAILVTEELNEDVHAHQLLVNKGEILFSDVKFNYSGAEPLFQNKSIKINAGQKVGLVGHSGGGKSTFVNLIQRLYDVTNGSIQIDGQNIQSVTLDSLGANIAMIPQDPSLFHRSLMDNIRYGRIDASDDEVIIAAHKANAHEFISKLSLGYSTLVGERGVKLSGGQRQRIAIARAILKNAPILILDEATSQLDSVTEASIQESLWDLMQNKTTLVIAHRLSTLLHMDRIIVFEQGKIVQDGTHEALVNQAGAYKTLWEAQVGGFLLD